LIERNQLAVAESAVNHLAFV